MKLRKFIYIALATFFFVGCTDLEDTLYDRIPEDKFPENEQQAALLSTPVYAPLQDFVDWSGWWFCQEIPSDEMTAPTRDTDWDDGGKWRVLHTHEWTNTTEAVAGMWSRFYRGVTEANRLIDLTFSPALPAEDAQVAIAKLKIMRAYYYYLLIDNYGDVPYVTSFVDAPEHPQKVARETIFARIVADLEESIPFLSDDAPKNSVSKGMAYSLLAKLYLNAEVYTGTPQWVKAEEACDSVIELGMYSLESTPLAPFVTDNGTSPENIFTIPYDEDNYEGFNLHMRTLHYIHDRTFDMSVGPWNGFAVMEDHFNTYANNDLRKEGFLVGQQYSSSGAELFDETAGAPLVLDPHIPALNMDASYSSEEIRMAGVRVAKFEIKLGAKENLSNDFPLFRYADILLMKAEAMIRQGGNGDDYVNEVRNRAGLDNWNNVTLEMLLEERGRELFWEGHRRQDLIRFGEFTKSWWEKPASSPSRETFPIPQWVLDSNPSL